VQAPAHCVATTNFPPRSSSARTPHQPGSPFNSRLFDGQGQEAQGSPYGAGKFAGSAQAAAAADAHLQDVCGVLKRLNADITVLSEVGRCV